MSNQKPSQTERTAAEKAWEAYQPDSLTQGPGAVFGNGFLAARDFGRERERELCERVKNAERREGFWLEALKAIAYGPGSLLEMRRIAREVAMRIDLLPAKNIPDDVIGI